jgi:hypothetical protein
LDIPLDFIVPSDSISEFPAVMLNAPLGRIFDALRKRRLYFTADDVRKLWRPLNIEFERRNQLKLSDLTPTTAQSSPADVFKSDPSLSVSQFTRLLEALTVCKELHGQFNVSTDFRIGVDSGYPAHLVNYPLGKQLKDIHWKGSWSTSPYRDQLVALGVLPPEDIVRHATLC